MRILFLFFVTFVFYCIVFCVSRRFVLLFLLFFGLFRAERGRPPLDLRVFCFVFRLFHNSIYVFRLFFWGGVDLRRKRSAVLKLEADLDATCLERGWTPLMYAASKGNLVAVFDLLDAGCRVNQLSNPTGE